MKFILGKIESNPRDLSIALYYVIGLRNRSNFSRKRHAHKSFAFSKILTMMNERKNSSFNDTLLILNRENKKN